jgi:hypothetical protein
VLMGPRRCTFKLMPDIGFPRLYSSISSADVFQEFGVPGRK